jgi:hypothetical protein
VKSSVWRDLAVATQERGDVFHPEAAIAPLADSVEGQFASIAQSLDGVHVQVEQLGHFTRREHGSQFI